MASDAADNLLRDVFGAWLLSVATVYDLNGKDATVTESYRKLQSGAPTEALGTFVERFLALLGKIEDCDEVTTWIGYSVTRRALWAVKSDLQQTLGLMARDMDLFRQDRPFSRMSAHIREATFWPLISAGQAIDLNRNTTLLPELVARAATVLERAALAEVRIPGIPIGGFCNAVLWIGFRTEVEIEAALGLSSDQDSKTLADALRYKLRQEDRALLLASDAKAFGKRPGQSKQGRPAKPTNEVSGRPDASDASLTGALSLAKEVSWEERATSLRLDPARTYDLLLLQLIAAVEHLGLTPAPNLVIKKLLAALTNEPIPWRMEGSIVRLEHEGWIQQGVSDTTPSAKRHADREGTLQCLQPVSDIGNCLGEIVRLLSKNERELDGERYRRLLSTALLRIEDADLLISTVTRLERSDEFDEHMLAHAARALASRGLFFETSMLLIRHRHLIEAENVRDVYLAIAIDLVLSNDAQVRNPIDQRDAAHLTELQTRNNARLEAALAEHLGLRKEASAATGQSPKLLTTGESLTPSAVARVEQFAKTLGDVHHHKPDSRTRLQKLLDALRYILRS